MRSTKFARGLLPFVFLALLFLTAPAKDEAVPQSPAAAARPGEALPKDWFWGNPVQRAVHDALVGKPMPDLFLSDWYGKPVQTKDLKGKIVVIDFWATWCRPCLMAIPHNNQLSDKYKSKGVVFLGVCCSPQGQERMQDVAKTLKVTYPQARDPQLKTESAWKVQWYPTYAVVDRKGKVRGVGLLPQNVEPALTRLLAE
jgi:thiol-disulfide isomerase/thioredoxin